MLQTSRLCLKTYYVVSEVTKADLPQGFKGISAGDVSGGGLGAERTDIRIPSSYHRAHPDDLPAPCQGLSSVKPPILTTIPGPEP